MERGVLKERARSGGFKKDKTLKIKERGTEWSERRKKKEAKNQLSHLLQWINPIQKRGKIWRIPNLPKCRPSRGRVTVTHQERKEKNKTACPTILHRPNRRLGCVLSRPGFVVRACKCSFRRFPPVRYFHPDPPVCHCTYPFSFFSCPSYGEVRRWKKPLKLEIARLYNSPLSW